MVKKLAVFMLTCMLLTSITACGADKQSNSADTEVHTEMLSSENETPAWDITNDAETFAESAAFAGEFYFAQGGDYTFELVVDWATGDWKFVCECPAAPNAASHVDYAGTGFEFDEETNTFSFIYVDDVTKSEVLFYSAYDETSNTYYINMFRNFNEFVQTPATWTPDVKFEYAD